MFIDNKKPTLEQNVLESKYVGNVSVRKKLQVALVTELQDLLAYVANLLLSEGWRVIGFDCMSDY